MILKNRLNKASIVSAAWLLLIVATGIFASVDSFTGWMMMSVLALGPGAVLLYLSRDVTPSISQTIHDARR